MKKKKLDIFNLFYSGAAVVILIGVIAKLLEWPAQDLLITLGLSIEAVVFGVSAIKYVEIEDKHEVVTEATFAKVADGLGNIVTSASVNLQTGSAETDLPTKPSSSNILNIASSSNPENSSKFGIDFQATVDSPKAATSMMPIASANASNTLWQLEQLDILSLSKDLFYQPDWNKLTTEEYNHVSHLFKTLFNKKVPTKESLPFLAQFPVKIPIPEIAELELVSAINLEVQDVEVLCKAFEVIKVTNLFEHFIIELVGLDILIRTKQGKETILFGGEDESVLVHCQAFYKQELIVSPNIDCLKSIIKLKDQFLVDYLIQKINIKNEAEFISLSEALATKQDDNKKKLFNKFKKIKYNTQNDAGYLNFKTLTKLAATFTDQILAQELLTSVLEIQVDETLTITNVDVVNSYSDTIYFGPKNEYSVILKDIFLNGELDNINYFNNLIEKLASDGITHKAKLLELFNLKEQDSKKEVFNKLNYHLAKTNTVASGAQLAFILLYKQYS